jgi:DNA-binding HxlR family transcriptional regulator
MCEESDCYCICPLEGIIDTISKKWALLIINALGNHQRLRFNRLMEELDGVSPKTLTDTLKILQQEGLVGRDSFAEIPPRVEYYLTEDGRQLRHAIVPLLTWASKRESFTNRCTVPCRKKSSHHSEVSHGHD